MRFSLLIDSFCHSKRAGQSDTGQLSFFQSNLRFPVRYTVFRGRIISSNLGAVLNGNHRNRSNFIQDKQVEIHTT